MNLNSAKCLILMSVLSTFGQLATAGEDDIDKELNGYQVVSSQSTNGTGRFLAKINRESREIEYQLSYSDLEGDIIQSHIHFGSPGTNGGIVTFLCHFKPSIAPVPTPECPAGRDGTVTGVIRPADVVYSRFGNQFPFDKTEGTISQQLIEPGEFDELVKAIDAGATNVIVHTRAQPSGELRGNLPGRKHGDN